VVSLIPRRLLIGLAGALAAVAGVATFAFATPSLTTSYVTNATGDAPPSSVESFSYPDAARILVSEGIQLKRGDGQILLAACDFDAQQIRVQTVADPSVGRKEMYCFEAQASSGYITMDLPRVFYLETIGHPISADLTADGTTKTINVPKGGMTSVGEGDIPTGGKRSVLVEIRVTG